MPAITLNQVRRFNSTYYKVVAFNDKNAECEIRNGPTGRYQNKTQKIPRETLESYELVCQRNDPSVDFIKEIQPTQDDHTVKLLKREIDTLKKQLTQHKTGEGLIIQAVKEAYEDPPDLTIPKLPLIDNNNTNITDNEIAVLHISDTQIGKVTSSYDCAVAEQRLLQLVEKTVAITNMRRSAAKIAEIRVYLGGDIVEGEEIFATQAHEIEQSVFDQAVKTAPAIIVKCILVLLKHFKKVVVRTVPGNHGRNGAHGGRAHPRTNWDNVCYEVAYWMLKGSDQMDSALAKRLDFKLNDKWYEVDYVYDWGNLIVHGDQITGGFAGFPFYGVSKKAHGWIDSIPQQWLYLYMGHWHTYAAGTLNHRYFMANGTTESDNTYAQSQLAATGHPCQRLTFYNEKYGLISDCQIFLTDNRRPNRNYNL